MSTTEKMSRWDVYKQLRAWDNQIDDPDGELERESAEELDTEFVDTRVIRRKVSADATNLTQELGIVSVDELFEPTVELVDYRDVLGGNILGDDESW